MLLGENKVKFDNDSLRREFEENHNEWMDKLLAGQPVSSFGARQLAEHMRTLHRLYELKQQQIDLITKLNALLFMVTMFLGLYLLAIK